VLCKIGAIAEDDLVAFERAYRTACVDRNVRALILVEVSSTLLAQMNERTTEGCMFAYLRVSNAAIVATSTLYRKPESWQWKVRVTRSV